MKANKNVFPYKLRGVDGLSTVYTGLNVRDYIAIQAMVGICAHPQATGQSFDKIADFAYKLADEMIKRSEK